MIITLTGATATKYLGGLNFYSIILDKRGVDITLSQTTIKKENEPNATVTGTITVLDGYTLDQAVSIVMRTTAGTIDKTSSWYDASTGTITIPTSEVTGNIIITARATSNSGSGDSGDTSIEAGTHTYSNAGYVLQSSGQLAGTTGGTWIHSDFIPIDSLADNSEGICVGTFIGHGTVAAIAFYKTKDDYTSYTEGFVLNSTSAGKVSQSAAEVKANITNSEAKYVVFSTDGSKATLEVTTA